MEERACLTRSYRNLLTETEDLILETLQLGVVEVALALVHAEL